MDESHSFADFIPVEVGDHQVIVKMSGSDKAGSTFSFTAYDAQKVRN
jgi:hypothetical protein